MLGWRLLFLKNYQYTSLLLISLALITLPFFFVQFIPSTDLPQHLAQIRLLLDIIKNPYQQEYVVEWFGANTLVYGLLWINWTIFSPIAAGKMAVLELALAWVVCIFSLAKHKQRSPVSAMLASLFIFNASFYWGFLNFLIGLPVFVLWYFFTRNFKEKRSDVIDTLGISVLGFLLFLAHVLWLIAGLIYLVSTMVHQRSSVKKFVNRGIALIPLCLYCVYWFPKLSEARISGGFNTAAYWAFSPWERIQPSWVIGSFFGGLRGAVEVIIFVGILIWIGFSVRMNWREIRLNIDKEFLLIAVLLVLIVFFAPEQYLNTIYFASRWAPLSMIFFLLALPLPRFSESSTVVIAVTFLAVLSLSTCYSWSRFEAVENSGLEASLTKVTDNSSVLGLDFVKKSEWIYGQPFLQTFAYSQVLHGGKLNFSFTKHHSSIVTNANIDTLPKWTLGLDWFPERVTQHDFKTFNYTLIHGSQVLHQFFASLPELKPVTTEGMWRLYEPTVDSMSILHNNKLTSHN